MAVQKNSLQKIPDPRSQEVSLLARDLRDTHLNTRLACKGQQSSSGVDCNPGSQSMLQCYECKLRYDINNL